MYQINSVVDINNLVSLESLNPAGTYDLEKITPPIELRIGAAGESYKGIGKDLINIESLPVFADAQALSAAQPATPNGRWSAWKPERS